MKGIELLKLGSVILKALQDACIRMNDVRYIAMYDEYEEMTSDGIKMSYISAVLSERYGISERQFFYIIKRLGQDCNIRAE